MRWIIGDIHGMLVPLEALLRGVEAADAECELLFVGDYVNRGPDSAAVVDLILALPEARCIRGNHDDIVDLVLNGECAYRHPNAQDPVAAALWFLQHGLEQTLASYGVEAAAVEEFKQGPSLPMLRHMLQGVPPSHRNFFRNLPMVIDEAEFFMVHASWPVDEPTNDPDVGGRLAEGHHLRQNALWGRFDDEDFGRKKAWERTGIFGHTPCSNYAVASRSNGVEPIQGPQIILVDTGAVLKQDGRLTAYCVDSHTFIQADAGGRLVDEE